MNAAAAPLPRSPEQRANEPSMEEILASIRRIIADDRILPLTPRPKPNPASQPLAAAAPKEEDAPLQEGVEEAVDGDAQMADDAIGIPEPDSESPSNVQSFAISSGEPRLSSTSSFDAEVLAGPIEAADPDCAVSAAAVPLAVVRPSQTRATTNRTKADPLLSAATDASLASSFQSLATTVFLQNSGAVEQSVRDMLRPMLKQWLDDNLPTMVEHLVRTEIERVARGGRS